MELLSGLQGFTAMGAGDALREVRTAAELSLAAMNRRDFLATAGLVAANAKLATELAASAAGNDPTPLTLVQTTHQVDRALAAFVDRGTVANLRRWMDDGDNAVLRVNAAGILAKLPGQDEAARVADALHHDLQMRERYMIAVAARVCGIDWATAERMVRTPTSFPRLVVAAGRFAREAVDSNDAGARWCSAAMLQVLAPTIGR